MNLREQTPLAHFTFRKMIRYCIVGKLGCCCWEIRWQIGNCITICFLINPLPTPGYPDFSRSGKSAAEFAQEPSQFARMAPGPSRRRGRLAPPTPRIWLTAGALLAVACQGGGERPLETSAGLSLAPWGLAEPAAAAARASEPVIAQPAVGQIRTSGAVPRAPGG